MIVFSHASPGTVILRLPADATSQFAADQLAYYIALATGARPAVANAPTPSGAAATANSVLELHLGQPTGHRCRDETVSLHVAGNAGVLTASSPAGLLFGVYRLVESFADVCWLNRWEGDENIPRTRELVIPDGDYSWSPRFSCRGFTNYPRIDPQTADFADWMAKCGFNQYVVNPQPAGALEAYRRHLRAALVLRGMKASLEHHTLPFWLPPSEYFQQHPEYFAKVDGQRRPEGQPCTSHPEVRRIIARRILDFLDGNPEIAEVGLWPRDGFGWCECEACSTRLLRPSRLWPDLPCRTDAYLEFVNDVAAKVAEERPEVTVTALAYLNYVDPPVSVTPLPNVVIYFAPFLRCMKHALEDSACQRRNPVYLEMLLRWRDATPGELRLFLYDLGVDTLSLPYPCAERLVADFDLYERLGVDGYVLEYVPEEWATFATNAHAIAFLSWTRKGRECDGLDSYLGRYRHALYGPSAAAMAEYFGELAVRLVEEGPCTGHYDLSWTRRATHAFLSPALEALGRALAAAAPEKAAWRSVRRAQVACEHLLRVGQWQRCLADAQKRRAGASARPVRMAMEAAEAVVEWAGAHGDLGALHAEKITARVHQEMQGWLAR